MEFENSKAFDTDDWNDIDFSDIVDDETAMPEEKDAEDSTEKDEEPAPEETAEADQPEAEEAVEPDTDEPKETEDVQTDQFELKHLDEVKTVGREEVIVLAQKGMDYDRIKAKLETREGKEAEAFSFLENLAKEQNMSVDDFMDSTKASLRAKKDGVDYATALQTVKMERREAALEKREKELQSKQAEKAKEDEADRRRQQDIAEFRKAYPDVDGKSIPKEVWADVAKGMSLLNAYAKFDNARIREALEAEKRNAENARRATGSKADTGKTKKADPFDDDWYNGD